MEGVGGGVGGGVMGGVGWSLVELGAWSGWSWVHTIALLKVVLYTCLNVY